MEVQPFCCLYSCLFTKATGPGYETMSGTRTLDNREYLMIISNYFCYFCIEIYSRTSVALTGSGLYKLVPAKGSSSHPGLVSV